MKILFFIAGLKLKILFRTRRKMKIPFILTEKWKSSSSFILGGVRDSRVPVPGVAGVPGSGADTEGHDWRHHPPLHAQGMSGLFGASNIIARSFIFVNKNSLVYFRQKKNHSCLFVSLIMNSCIFIKFSFFMHIQELLIHVHSSAFINSWIFVNCYSFMYIHHIHHQILHLPTIINPCTFVNNY